MTYFKTVKTFDWTAAIYLCFGGRYIKRGQKKVKSLKPNNSFNHYVLIMTDSAQLSIHSNNTYAKR